MSMKILGLQIQGFGIIGTMELEFKNKGLTPIVGANNQGKSTVLKALEVLISGGKIGNDIVNHDSKKALIIGTVGEYIIKKIITGKTVRLEVSKDNMILKSPQEFLNTLKNDLSFNPFNFINKTPTEKKKEFMNYAGIDFSEINEKIRAAEDDRKFQKRKITEQGILGEAPDKEMIVNIEPLTEERLKIEDDYKSSNKKHIASFNEEVKAVNDFNKEQENIEKDIDNLRSKMKDSEKTIAGLTEKLKQANGYKDGLNNKLNYISINNAVKPLKETPVLAELPEPDYSDIDSRITEVNERNIKAGLYSAFIKKVSKFNEDTKNLERIEEIITAHKEEKANTYKIAKLPVEGLELREEGLYYKGTYIENLSTSEALKLACNICIKQNPKLRAITIDRGECFDKGNIEFLEKFGEENDFQLIMTQVDSLPETKKDGVIYIQDGSIV